MNRALPLIFVFAATPALALPTLPSAYDGGVKGHAWFEDATTTHTGDPSDPAHLTPDTGDTLQVEVWLQGQGFFIPENLQCTLDTSGTFDALYEGEAMVRPNGIYLSGYSSAEALLETSAGCGLSSLEGGFATEAWIRGSIEADYQTCEVYCEAKARAYGEDECGFEPGAASCRSSAEAMYEASCSTACSDEAVMIVGETRIRGGGLARINQSGLTGGAFGVTSANLTFDHMVDEDGDMVDEAP